MALTPHNWEIWNLQNHPFPDTTAEPTASGKALSIYGTHPFLFNTK